MMLDVFSFNLNEHLELEEWLFPKPFAQSWSRKPGKGLSVSSYFNHHQSAEHALRLSIENQDKLSDTDENNQFLCFVSSIEIHFFELPQKYGVSW
jgi:hypothetical protein